VRHVQGLDLRRLVVDAENVRRSAWPNLTKEELVSRSRAWAERENADLLVVFDGDPPGEAPDLIGSGSRSADDVIAELDGPFWLATSDRELRARVGAKAEKIIGGGAFLRQLETVKVLKELGGLALEIEDVDLTRKELAVSPEFRRVTTTVHLHGSGEEGQGEDVTYLADLHDDAPVPDVAGRWTLDSFSASLDGFRFFAALPEDDAAQDYRRWAWESAALDLTLSQAGTSLAGILGRERRPVRYVVSTRVKNVMPLLELYPGMRFKLDPGPDWGDETIDRLSELGCVDTADFKGVYRGSFGQPPDPELYTRIAEAFPEAWLEDPGLVAETDEVLRPHRDRITWDAPIHSVADAEALPFPPRCLNVKPSRFGTVRRLFEFYEWCERRGVSLYGGGQFELGIGRLQIQELASIFHADMPNDVAPAEFNAPELPRGVQTSPLPPPHAFGTKS
jgi:hypothetical protein